MDRRRQPRGGSAAAASSLLAASALMLGACLGTISGPPAAGAEGQLVGRFAGNVIEIYDAGGARLARIETERAVDNLLDFDAERVLYKMATAEGLPDGAVHSARLDGVVEPDPRLPLRVRSARIHTDGRTVALSTWEHELYLWDLKELTLDGPIQGDVTTFGIHFEPKGSYRLLIDTETGVDPSLADAFILDIATGDLVRLPTDGRAVLARWSGPGRIVYTHTGHTFEMDVETGAEVEVDASVHADARREALNVWPGLPSGDLGDGLGSVTAALAPSSYRLPFEAGETWCVTQAYGTFTHTGLNQYALDITAGGCGSWGEPILSVTDGVVSHVGGPASNTCADPGACTGCANSAGLRVDVTHLGDYVSSYYHNSATHVDPAGDNAACQGRRLADCGNSGWSCGSACPAHPGTHTHVRMLDGGGSPVLMEPISGYSGISVPSSGCLSVTSDNSLTNSCSGSPPPPPAPTCGSECDYCWYGTASEGNCPATWNGTADGCDCGCQFTDPDCSAAPPPPAPTCGSECDYCWYGTASEGNCPATWNGTADGCDCGCQFTDPDCSAPPPPPAPTCGDGSCNGTETCSSCATDCGVCPPPPPSCGDGSCNGAETCSSCATDCGACPPPPPSCGDGSCNGTETCSSCATDCGACPPPPPPPSCGDGFEPNDSSTSATAVSSGSSYCGLGICGGDVDWFSFNVTSGLTATITFSHAQGDLDLEIYSAGCVCYVAGSYGVTGSEQVALAGLAPGVYWARVYGFGGAQSPDYCFSVSTF